MSGIFHRNFVVIESEKSVDGDSNEESDNAVLGSWSVNTSWNHTRHSHVDSNLLNDGTNEGCDDSLWKVVSIVLIVVQQEFKVQKRRHDREESCSTNEHKENEIF